MSWLPSFVIIGLLSVFSTSTYALDFDREILKQQARYQAISQQLRGDVKKSETQPEKKPGFRIKLRKLTLTAENKNK